MTSTKLYLRSSVVVACALALGLLLLCSGAKAARSPIGFATTGKAVEVKGGERPDHTEYAKMARYVVHNNLWGVMATHSIDTGFPYSNVVDLSDGPVCNSTGRLFFYLTTMDETAYDVTQFPRVSFSVTEASIVNTNPLGCGTTDAEDPTCAKLTVIGDLAIVPDGEQSYARDMIAARHPQTRSWPANHGFKAYELQIEQLLLLDFYGGMKHVSVQDYFNVQLTCQ